MITTKYTISPTHTGPVEANVFLGGARGYYNPIAKKAEMITLLPGSHLSKYIFNNGWVPDNIAYLIREGFIEEKTNIYEVIKPICGSPSGTAAFAQGQEGPSSPNGYKLWKFANGQTIEEAGERPNK
ncbi:DUF4357 domain-containing protein [Cytobacillus praedii]|uniref:DUF4357 domain-containing protein n=1 Tax=Cytobacillus praedii TaxID=1742358 RepID=UPI003F7FDA95